MSRKVASFSCAMSRDSPVFEPSHGAHRQATLVVDGGFGRGLQHTSYRVRADSASYIARTGVVSEQMSSCRPFGGSEDKTATERK